MLALTATSAFGQEATTPPLDGPIVAAPPTTTTVVQPTPVLVIPDASPVEAQAVPTDPVVATSTANTTRATAPQPQTRAVRPAASQPAARAETVAAATVAEPIAEEPVAATESEAALPPVAPIDEPTNIQPTPEQATDITAVLGLILVSLIGLVLAVFAFAALRRRRAAMVESEIAPVQRVSAPRETVSRPVASVAEPAPLAEPVASADRAPARALRANGAAVPLPARMPENYEERDALLRRMIDAAPDRANPFTDRRARMRRARLILQSLDRKFDNAKPWIDLSDYPENWPSQARRSQPMSTPIHTRELEPA